MRSLRFSSHRDGPMSQHDARGPFRVRRAMQLLWSTLLLAPALVSAPAQAQSYREVSGRVFLNGTVACQASSAGPLEQSCSGAGTAGEVRGSIGSDGLLHAEARVSDQRYQAQDEVHAWAQALLFDRLSFDGQVIPTSVRLSLFLHGGVTGSNSSYGALSVYHGGVEPVHTISIDGTTPSGGIGWGFPSAPTLRVERTTFTMAVENGRVDFGIALMARAHLPLPTYDEDRTHCGIYDCVGRGARSDFLNTAGVELIEGLDADGNVISGGFLVRSAANVQYAVFGQTPVPVPEPSTSALLLAGAAAGAVMRRWRTDVTG
jgi:hypothetical protein